MITVGVEGRCLRPDPCDFEVEVKGWHLRLAQMSVGCLRHVCLKLSQWACIYFKAKLNIAKIHHQLKLHVFSHILILCFPH